MDIFKLLNNDTEGMSEEEKIYIEKFSEALREKIIDELVEIEGERLEELLRNDREKYMDVIYGIFTRGVKGYDTLSLQLLIDIYLENKGNEGFINLVKEIE